MGEGLVEGLVWVGEGGRASRGHRRVWWDQGKLAGSLRELSRGAGSFRETL